MAREPQDVGLLVRFYKEMDQRLVPGKPATETSEATEDSYEAFERDCISIIVPGSRDDHRCVMNDDYKRRFKTEYAEWKANEGRPITGIPLTEWPMATSSFVAEMATYGVRSVEELAELSEAFAVSPSALTMKAKAQSWLASRQSAESQSATIAENEELKKKVAALEAASKKK